MKSLIDFFAARSSIPPARLILMAVVAGISNAMILGLLNAGAANAARGEGLGSLLLMFGAAVLVYVYAQPHEERGRRAGRVQRQGERAFRFDDRPA
jgi:hypothetical protein